MVWGVFILLLPSLAIRGEPWEVDGVRLTTCSDSDDDGVEFAVCAVVDDPACARRGCPWRAAHRGYRRLTGTVNAETAVRSSQTVHTLNRVRGSSLYSFHMRRISASVSAGNDWGESKD